MVYILYCDLGYILWIDRGFLTRAQLIQNYIDHFSIEIHGFGVPPFSETATCPKHA